MSIFSDQISPTKFLAQKSQFSFHNSGNRIEETVSGEPELWEQQQPGDQLEPKRWQQLQPDVPSWKEEKASSSFFSCSSD